MDDYIKSIKEQVKTQENIEPKHLSNYRDLFLKFIKSDAKVKIEKIKDGDVTFSIAIKDMGLNYQDIQKYRSEIFSHLAVNFIGEVLVRENINEFANILTKIDKNRYADVVNGFEHKKFGLKINRNRFNFCFHISLVQSILNEGFRREVRRKMERS